LALAGVFVLVGLWGTFYVRFVAFPSTSRPFLEEIGGEIVWIGLVILVMALLVYIYIAWHSVKKLKRILVYPRTGQAEHRFLMPVDHNVFLWYSILYVLGIALLYGLFVLMRGGFSVMSVPLIISPAVMSMIFGRIYSIRRHQWIAAAGFVLAVSLELFITTPADYMTGPRNFLDVLPQWGSPALASYIWAVMFAISGLIGLTGVRRYEDGSEQSSRSQQTG
jgi:hypothetical protein